MPWDWLATAHLLELVFQAVQLGLGVQQGLPRNLGLMAGF
jgi:hypothetical protein